MAVKGRLSADADHFPDLIQKAGAFFGDFTGEVPQLGGDTLDHGDDLILVNIDTEQILDRADGIRGKPVNQIFFPCQLFHQCGNNALNIHSAIPPENTRASPYWAHPAAHIIRKTACGYKRKNAMRKNRAPDSGVNRMKNAKSVERFGRRR